jgi:hypothetical protein
MSLRPRVPGTPGRRRREPDLSFELATGGRPAERFAAALAELVPRAALGGVAVMHDDECPCLVDGLSMLACTCEVVRVRVFVFDVDEVA